MFSADKRIYKTSRITTDEREENYVLFIINEEKSCKNIIAVLK